MKHGREQELVAALKPADDEIEALTARHAQRSFPGNDAEWQSIRTAAIGNRKLGWRTMLKRYLSAGRNGRHQDQVAETYRQHYGQLESTFDWLKGLDGRFLPAEWRGNGYLLSAQALRLANLLYIRNAIRHYKPRKVLEVGCGNGNLLISLAACFPEVEFCGVERSPQGVELAEASRTADQLPDWFAGCAPGDVLDHTAHRRIRYQQGDARQIDLPDQSFDLVFTRLALEQMEQVRSQAMAEICRIAGTAVALVEPWYDFNKTDPGRSYIKRVGYFQGRASDLEKNAFRPVLIDDDIPQKVQFKAGAVIAQRA